MPELHTLLRPPYNYLILGVITFSAAVVSTCTGKTIARYAGWVYRAKEPTQYWGTAAMYYLGAVLSIGIFLYQAHAL
jgi:hypothetical protein